MSEIDQTAELQHRIRELLHEAAGWQAKYQNERMLRDRHVFILDGERVQFTTRELHDEFMEVRGDLAETRKERDEAIRERGELAVRAIKAERRADELDLLYRSRCRGV